MELYPFLLTSRWVSLSNLPTSRLVMDKDWTTEGQRSLLSTKSCSRFYKNPKTSKRSVPSYESTLRAFPLMFKTRRSFRGLSPSHSVSVRVMSVSRLLDRSRYCRFFRRWDVKQGITKTCLDETKLFCSPEHICQMLKARRQPFYLSIYDGHFPGVLQNKPTADQRGKLVDIQNLHVSHKDLVKAFMVSLASFLPPKHIIKSSHSCPPDMLTH